MRQDSRFEILTQLFWISLRNYLSSPRLSSFACKMSLIMSQGIVKDMVELGFKILSKDNVFLFFFNFFVLIKLLLYSNIPVILTVLVHSHTTVKNCQTLNNL